MRPSCLSLILFTFACLALGTCGTPGRSKRFLFDWFPQDKSFVRQLFDKTSDEQAQHDEPLIDFIRWHKAKGLYSSEVRLNFHGGPAFSEMRRMFNVYDNNMFATAWVTSNLLEAYKFTGAPRPTDNQVEMALQAISQFVDKNVNYKTSDMIFWPQVLNETTHFWRSTPDNLFTLLGDATRFPTGILFKILEDLGLKALAEQLRSFVEMSSTFADAFRVPPDFDDTFVNLGLGAALYELRSDFESGWTIWNNNNKNITSVFKALKKYAYRPFSNDSNTNTIDPRTYYYIRGFLDEAQAKGESIALVPTWVQNIVEDRAVQDVGNQMPFQINNVDLTVAANSVYGLTKAVLSGLVDKAVLEDKDIAQIYLNSTSLIAYEINNSLMNRPDLALTYYPSRVEFYWFVSRTFNILEAAKRVAPLPVPVMLTVYDKLKSVLEGSMTKYLEDNAILESVDNYYFEDFLGNADVDIFNLTVKRGEDRIFTTSMAANALLYTWTYYNETTKTIHWREETPQKVQDIVDGTINWLTGNALSGKYKPWNTFFSGSVKGLTTLPFAYPGNRFEYLNGTKIDDWTHLPNNTVNFLYGVEGYIPQSKYQEMVQEKHFGMDTPTQFKGFNAGSGPWPFWSSVPFTYSSALMAVSRFENIVG